MRRYMDLCVLSILCACCCGCSPQVGGADGLNSYGFFAMDTYIQITAPFASDDYLFSEAETEIRRLETLISVTEPGSDLWVLNHANGESVKIVQETADLIEQTLALCESTNGALNIALYPVIREWGFTTGDFHVPKQTELERLLTLCDWKEVKLDGDSVQMSPGMELDLGAVGKGYASNRLADLFRDAGVSSALLSLGGNIYALGEKEPGTPWRIGIQDPLNDKTLGVVGLCDQAAITSGGYQRYFEENGKIYHHIIDYQTGYPADSGLLSVTVICEDGLLGDALSTAFFVMGVNDALDYWRTLDGVDLVLVTKERRIYVTPGLKNSFALNDNSENYVLEWVEK